MSRIAVVVLTAAWLSMPLGLMLAAEEREKSSEASAAQSGGVEPCAVRSEAASSGEPCTCPARSQSARARTLEAQEMPVYVPPNRGSPATRIGGANRGGARPMRRI